MIDIIIPAYNAEKTIARCLSSIAMQTIIDKCRVTIVSDADDVDYDKYSNLVPCEFRVLRHEENRGPGDARQTGLDAATGEYVTFIDADDTFSSAYALEGLVRNLDMAPTAVMVSGNFLEEHPNLQFVPHENDLIWMFGKVYRRSYLKRMNIHFLPGSRSNEDNGFNTTIRLLSDENSKIIFDKNCAYFWMYSDSTITRMNDGDYTYNASFPGYVDNMIFAINNAREVNPFSQNISEWTVQVMCQLYIYWSETAVRAPQYAEQNYEHCKRFAPLFFALNMPEKALNERMSAILKASYAGGRLDGVMLTKTFEDFMNGLKD